MIRETTHLPPTTNQKNRRKTEGELCPPAPSKVTLKHPQNIYKLVVHHGKPIRTPCGAGYPTTSALGGTPVKRSCCIFDMLGLVFDYHLIAWSEGAVPALRLCFRIPSPSTVLCLDDNLLRWQTQAFRLVLFGSFCAGLPVARRWRQEVKAPGPSTKPSTLSTRWPVPKV